MDASVQDTERDDIWQLREALNELSATQAQHSERIMQLEKRNDDGGKMRSVWGPSSPFPSAVSHHESSLNPSADAFRNFGVDPPNMISSLTLDNNDEARRAAASRANFVRFDESANNHHGSSRMSMELPTRTGSGLGSHPLSERSLSHRSEKGSTSGFGRTNSFGLESSRLLGSIHNSPRVSGNPPPGFFVLGPCPSIVRCWLTETFTNDSLLYAAICSGSSSSSIGMGLLQKLGLVDSVIEENGLRKVKLLVYLTEAKIQLPSSRSASPAPQVPTVTVKFVIHEQQPTQEKTIQIVLGSDVLRRQSADILFSQDKIVLFDDDRNQLSIPFVRPEDDAVYKNLATRPRSRRESVVSDAVSMSLATDHSAPGVIGRPGRADSTQPPSPTADSSLLMMSSSGGDSRRVDASDLSMVSSVEMSHPRAGDDSKSTTGSEKSATTPAPKSMPGVWSNSWRSSTGSVPPETRESTRVSSGGSYARPGANRPMKILRPSAAKGMATATRTTSSAGSFINGPDGNTDAVTPSINTTEQKLSSNPNELKTPLSAKPNPIGSATAFPWLSQGQARKTTVMK